MAVPAETPVPYIFILSFSSEHSDESTYSFRVGQIGELRLECGLLVVASAAEEVIIGITEGSSVIVGRELVCIVSEESFLTSEEIVSRRLGTRVLDVGLR
jgi:hypothetical protein